MKRILLLVLMMVVLAGCAAQKGRSVQAVPFDDYRYEKIFKINRALVPYIDPGAPLSKYRVGIIADATPNAMTDDKYRAIYTTGLFFILDDNELACVVAHEMAHTTMRHIPKERALSGSVTVAFMVANMFVPGVGYLNHAVNPLASKAYSRENEREADRKAVEYVGAYMTIDKEHCASALEKLLAYAKRNKLGTDGGWLSDHPGLEERIRAIREMK
jgi:Zn-dependent protease with chaperone function